MAIVDGNVLVNVDGKLSKAEFNQAHWHSNMPDIKVEYAQSKFLYENECRLEGYKGRLTVAQLIERENCCRTIQWNDDYELD